MLGSQHCDLEAALVKPGFLLTITDISHVGPCLHHEKPSCPPWCWLAKGSITTDHNFSDLLAGSNFYMRLGAPVLEIKDEPGPVVVSGNTFSAVRSPGLAAIARVLTAASDLPAVMTAWHSSPQALHLQEAGTIVHKQHC